jgi:hypothetical protein
MGFQAWLKKVTGFFFFRLLFHAIVCAGPMQVQLSNKLRSCFICAFLPLPTLCSTRILLPLLGVLCPVFCLFLLFGIQSQTDTTEAARFVWRLDFSLLHPPAFHTYFHINK